MSEGKHTPGQWMVFDHYCGRDPETAGDEYARTRLVGLGQYDTIAEVRHGNDDIPGDVDANARLIAAAPDLLATCERMIPRNVCLTNRNVPEDAVVSLDVSIGELRAIAAAIAKARGEA